MLNSRKIPVETEKAPMPVGPYNQAIIVGDIIYCSGQIAIKPETGTIIEENDIEKQTIQVFKNLIAVLESCNSSTANIIKTTVFLKNLKDFNSVNKIYADFFEGTVYPARACVEVSALPKDALVEIDCIALINKK